MFDEQVKPRLAKALPPFFMARRQLRMALLPESTVDARTAPIYKQFADVETTILAHSGEIQLHFECAKGSLAEAQARVDVLAEAIENEMDEDVFSSHGESLEEVVLLLLGMRHMNLATAESCTGGMLAQRFTAIPDSSRGFLGGVVVYVPELKVQYADVPQEVIDREGAVSEAVARHLAEGIRAKTGASIGIGITGPGGGVGADAEKPIGLVYIGLASDLGTQVKEVNLPGDRERVRWWATQHALEMVRRHLLHG